MSEWIDRTRRLRATLPAMPSMEWVGAAALIVMLLACVVTLPYTLGEVRSPKADAADESMAVRRYAATDLDRTLLPPLWFPHTADERAKLDEAAGQRDEVPQAWLGTDSLGRDVLVRCLAGGGVSLGIGLSAAVIAVVIGTLYGTTAGFAGGRLDAVMMRSVDVLYGLPYILLVVLLAVAVDGLLANMGGGVSPNQRQMINVVTLLVAIGGVSWLTMARVIRGQVLSLRNQPFMEACRATGVPVWRQFVVHLLPNLLGPIVVYATLTVPAAILSESFLSFLGIGVRAPLPSWGNLAAEGLSELNTVRSRWWLLFWPCVFIAITLLALNFVGEGLRERFDPRRRVASGRPDVSPSRS